jgi:serine protease Do
MKRLSTILMMLLVSALLVAGCAAPAPTALQAAPIAQAAQPTAQQVGLVLQATQPAVASNASVDALALEGTFEQIYAQVSPSVVRIRVVQKSQATTPQGGRGLGQGQAPQYSQGLGSGFVVDKLGNIVTNNHVIDGADSIYVTFADGTTYPGKVVAADPDSDLAVVKVDAPAGALQPVQIGDSTQVKVGQLAIAIGNPFGEQNTMTMGIVSALGRTLPATNSASAASQASYSIPDVIQTDAPINPGNSGGVLVDINGRLIGVTAAIESSTNSSAGIGFAIPSAIVKRVLPVLVAGKQMQHSYLGLSGGTMTPELASAMNLPATQLGALVASVTPGGPADKAGIKGSATSVTVNGQQTSVGGDVIVAIDSQKVTAFDDIVAYLASSTDVGQTVALTVLRGGQQQIIKVTLAARPTASLPLAMADAPVVGAGLSGRHAQPAQPAPSSGI